MALTKEHLCAVMTGTDSNRVEALRQVLGYPVKQRDPGRSRFWYLRPGENKSEAEETCPIAVGFYSELNEATEQEIKRFLTSKEQQEIYGHYIQRVAENQPVMYVLLPEASQQGRVALVLPTEGGLRQRQIQTFDWSDHELLGRLGRLQQGTLRVASRAFLSIPQIDWAFYPGVKTAEKLAQLMAEIARQIEKAIPAVHAAQGRDGYLDILFESFKKELLPALKLTADNEKDYSFADIYAQTVAYGLFTARVFGFLKFKREQEKQPGYVEPDFYRDNAWENLPETNPFLRRLFQDISEQPPETLGEELVGAVSELLSVLRAAEMEAVLSDFQQKIGQEDIIIRFYEDFLKAYKPEMRERRGVYYTPEPVVSYIVRSVDQLLKDKFNKPLGLADPEVMILDPACGTATYLLWISQLIHERFHNEREVVKEKVGNISWSDYVKDHLLPRILGFELLMAPYAIAHLKLSLFLEETGYQFNSGKRLRVYLTNTIDDAIRKSETLFEEFIAEEADQATEIKRDLPIMVILGNPPYSANSANTGEWAANLVRESYYPRDGIKEQNPKLLLDDYVKFIRFAQWRIEQTGYGILSFITNHGYLDNPTFRGMRQSLMQTFDSICTLDVHGNSKKKEKNPSGSKDENVFDIQQGVAIGIFSQSPSNSEKQSTIHHADLWGTREVKYEWLCKNHLTTTKWTPLKPQLPFSLFLPQDTALLPEYEQGWKITDIMPLNSTGVKTHRDHFVLDFNLSSLEERIKDFIDLNISDKKISDKYNLPDTRDWKINERRASLASNSNLKKRFTKCLYRPFDWREYYHHADVVELPKDEVSKHILSGKNLVFMWTRPLSPNYEFSVLAGNSIPHQCVVGNKTAGAGASYFAPLYLYPDVRTSQQLVIQEDSHHNLSSKFIKEVKKKLGYSPTSKALFYYIYAIFYSPTYRTRYAEFLKIDFPRVPLSSDGELFCQLAAFGEELVALHLMTSPKLENLITQFVERGGSQVVDAGHPKFQQGNVVINKKGDRFTGVPENVWNFYVGGYQVCQKWLKDRKGRILSNEDIQHYQRIVVALKETIELMAKIDAAIPEWPIQ